MLVGTDVDLFANDLSIYRQYHDVHTFRTAVAGLMAMRNVARRFGRDIHCSRGLASIEPIPDIPMQKVVQQLVVNERRALMAWLRQVGPFWDDIRRHGANDYLECLGDIVTDTAVGEAAYRNLHGVKSGLISASPSDWTLSPIEVTWNREAEGQDNLRAVLENWWDTEALTERLQEEAPPILSWIDLRNTARIRFRSLTFTKQSFEPLLGVPFAKSGAERIVVLLDILDRFARAFDADGARTAEGNQIYRDYFTGDRSLFSDSSEREKRKFSEELTFPHPDNPEESLLCTWHGKERHLTLRLHFSWPVRSGEPVYIVYVGPKLTKR